MLWYLIYQKIKNHLPVAALLLVSVDGDMMTSGNRSSFSCASLRLRTSGVGTGVATGSTTRLRRLVLRIVGGGESLLLKAGLVCPVVGPFSVTGSAMMAWLGVESGAECWDVSAISIETSSTSLGGSISELLMLSSILDGEERVVDPTTAIK